LAERKPMSDDLRRRAEASLGNDLEPLHDLSAEEIQRLVHELRTHQVELELQNEELRGAQDQLAAARDRYADLYDFAPVGYLSLDEKGLVREVNLTLADLLKLPRREVVGQRLAAFIHREDQDRYYRFRRALADKAEAQTCELRVCPPDGEFFWAALQCRPVQGFRPTTDTDHRLRLYHCAVTDTTVRRRAEEALRTHGEELEDIVEQRTAGLATANRSLRREINGRREAETALREREEHYRRLVEGIPGIVYAFSDKRGGIYYSQGIQSILGWTTDQVRANPSLWRESIHPDDAPHIDECVRRSSLNGRFEMDYRIRDAEGHWHWFHDRSIGRRVEGDETIIEGLAIDITAAKRSEEDADRLRAELTRATRITTMGELAASLAHELSQPLSGILSNAQAAQSFLAARPPDLREVAEALADIVEDDTRAADVINRVRTLLRRGELRKDALDVNEVVREVLGLLHSEIVQRDVSVELDLCSHPTAVLADRVQLQQVMMNLLMNALEALGDAPGDAGHVMVRTTLDQPSEMLVEICDSGTGLTQAEAGEVFHPFVTTKINGMGMGLSICRSIVEAHGGRIWARNNRDGGATFAFVLPTVQAPPPP
jgi:PAS domain S-box-containing protein